MTFGPLVAVGDAAVVNAVHDVAQHHLQFSFLPRAAFGVLAHFEAGYRHAARIGRFARCEHDLGGLEHMHRFQIARHIRAFGHRLAAIGHQGACIRPKQFVLRGARQRHIARHVPRGNASVESRASEMVGIVADPPAAVGLVFLHPVDLFQSQPVRIDNEPAAVGQGDRLRAQLHQLFRRVGGHVAAAGDYRHLAGQILPAMLQHILKEIHRAVAGCFWPDHRSAIFQPLARQHAGKLTGDALVLAEHIADLAPAHADIACRNVHIRADMAVEFGHERLAEAHDFAHALALGVEVRPALAAAHRQAGECVLEGLFKREKLQHAFVHRRVEADAALVRADRVVVLDAVAALHADIAGIVFPADAERYHAVRLSNAAQDLFGVVCFLVLDEIEDVFRHFLHRLHEFRLVRIALVYAFHEGCEVNVIGHGHKNSPLPRSPRVPAGICRKLLAITKGFHTCLAR